MGVPARPFLCPPRIQLLQNQVFGMKYTNRLSIVRPHYRSRLRGDNRSPAGRASSFSKVSEDYEKVEVSDQQNKVGLFNLWKRDKDGQLLGELPRKYADKSYFIALTVSSGDRYAGLQSGDMVVQWRRYDDRLALIAPNLAIRATGDPESKASVKRLFTDEVLLDVPIVAMGPGGGPVIDMDSLLIDNATKFFGPSGTHQQHSHLVSAISQSLSEKRRNCV